MKFAHIVFMQESEALEAERILNDHGPNSAIDHLSQWDSGEYHDTSETPRHGSRDKIYTRDDYILSYNPHLPYIGLEKIIED